MGAMVGSDRFLAVGDGNATLDARVFPSSLEASNCVRCDLVPVFIWTTRLPGVLLRQ